MIERANPDRKEPNLSRRALLQMMGLSTIALLAACGPRRRAVRRTVRRRTRRRAAWRGTGATRVLVVPAAVAVGDVVLVDGAEWTVTGRSGTNIVVQPSPSAAPRTIVVVYE